MILQTIEWLTTGAVKFIDQTKLPKEKTFIICKTKEEVFGAIKCLSVRGAPAIGIAGAYGVCVDILSQTNKDIIFLKKQLIHVAKYLKTSRPTAVNLFWALDRMIKVSNNFSGTDSDIYLTSMVNEAKLIHEEDKKMCEDIGRHGSLLIKNNMNILTHCNAGSLATGGQGTALSVFYQALKEKRKFSVYADETRPLLQGSRLTAFELLEAGIDVTVICDNMAGFLMKKGKIDMVITGADRIALNGDSANKIGTYSIAKLAKQFNIPFYIAAPSSTFDHNALSEEDIPIEFRDGNEIINGFNTQTGPLTVKVFNPAFDVTEGDLIEGFITEKGLIKKPFLLNISKFLS